MLIQIKTNMVTTALDLILVENFHLQTETLEKNTFISGADMDSSVHIDNKNKDILIPGEVVTQGLDYTTLTAEAKYLINFTQPRKRFVLSLH